jgi:hypothetical protein
MTELVIELKSENCIDGDWIPALKLAALEVQALNQLAAEGTAFPRPIECNPDSEIPEGFLGVVNTPPSSDGMVTIRTAQYEWINLAFLPQNPSTFSFILGRPPQVGAII